MAEVYPTPSAPAPAPKKRNRLLIGCAAVFALLVVCGGLSSLMNRGGTAASPTAVPAAVAVVPTLAPTAAPTDAPAAIVPTEAPAPTEAAAPTDVPAATEAPAAPAAAAPAGDIVFGEPVIFDPSIIGVTAMNPGDTIKSFFVKATYKNGDTIVGTASGAVNDLLPGQTRAATLLAQEPIPAEYESVRVDVDTMTQDAATTAGATAAQKITFGPPQVGQGGIVNVEVTAGDEAVKGMFVQAMFTRDGKLVGVASGAVNDLAAGQTKTATLLAQGETEGADVQVTVETIVP